MASTRPLRLESRSLLTLHVPYTDRCCHYYLHFHEQISREYTDPLLPLPSLRTVHRHVLAFPEADCRAREDVMERSNMPNGTIIIHHECFESFLHVTPLVYTVAPCFSTLTPQERSNADESLLFTWPPTRTMNWSRPCHVHVSQSPPPPCVSRTEQFLAPIRVMIEQHQRFSAFLASLDASHCLYCWRLPMYRPLTPSCPRERPIYTNKHQCVPSPIGRHLFRYGQCIAS